MLIQHFDLLSAVGRSGKTEKSNRARKENMWEEVGKGAVFYNTDSKKNRRHPTAETTESKETGNSRQLQPVTR